MLPCSNASDTLGKLAANSAIWVSGTRDVVRRKRMTEGLEEDQRERRVPKSVSAEITTRSSLAVVQGCFRPQRAGDRTLAHGRRRARFSVSLRPQEETGHYPPETSRL
jgi:hypothetical protein